MNKNDDEIKRDNPFDESFYTLPEDTDDAPAMEEDSMMDDSLDLISQTDADQDAIILDLEGVSDKEDLYSRIRDAIEVPDYFGNNLDALYDVLTEDFEEKTIVVKGIEQSSDEMKDYMKKFRRLCDDVAEENEAIQFVFE